MKGMSANWRSNAEFEICDNILFVALDRWDYRKYYIGVPAVDRDGEKCIITMNNIRVAWSEIIAWMPLPVLGDVEAGNE